MLRLYKILKVLLFCATIAAPGITVGKSRLSHGDHFAPVNGIRIHYYVSGTGPVCLLPAPGWGPSINYLKSSLTPFEKLFTIVYYDTRMSGTSTGPTDKAKYTSLDLMNDMDALRIYLKQPRVWIMGHSMGGFQVLNYGIHHNNKLKGIIALSAMAGQDSIYRSSFNKMLNRRKNEPYYNKGVQVLFGTDSAHLKISEGMQYILPFYFHDIQKMQVFIKLGDPQLSDKAYEYTEASRFGTEYLFPHLHKITVPVLIVVGDDDFICDMVSQSGRIKARIPASTAIVIKDAGHFSWI